MLRSPSSRSWGAVRTGALLACLASTACSSSESTPADSPDAASPGTAGLATSGSADDADPGQSSDGFPGETSGEGGSTSGFDDEADESSSGGEPLPPPEVGDFAPCPVDPPPGWIFCEDFETARDPAAVFFDYHDADGAFVIAEDGGASGIRAMRARFRPQHEGAGFLSIAFGENPVAASDRPGYEGDEKFDEIFWRFRLKTEAGWPDVGPGQLTQVSALAQENWAQAMVAAVSSAEADVTLVGQGRSCVVGSSVPCEGFDDSEKLAPLGMLPGSTRVYATEASGDWQCIEVHVRLNDPGMPNGLFEYWVDDVRENGRENIDWRGTWSEYGLNLISIENFWPGGPPQELDRWVDDIVVSTSPIGCD